jgi:surface antigen
MRGERVDDATITDRIDRERDEIMTTFKTIAIAFLGLALVSCTQQQQNQSGIGTKTVLGGTLGAAGGGLLASQLGGGATGIAAGVLLGGLLGGVAGNALDQNDREQMNQSTTNTLETSRTGQTSNWNNPDSGNSGTITPTRTFQRADGTYCREFTQTVNIGGEVQQAHGTACRQPDGTWKIVE